MIEIVNGLITAVPGRTRPNPYNNPVRAFDKILTVLI